MVLSSPPTTPDRPIQPSVRRAFTAPVKPLRDQGRSDSRQDQESETLFAHEAAKIVAFTATDPSGRPLPLMTLGGRGSSEEPIGILPWGSLTERTVAAGPLRIYRVMNSVAFLNSGNVVHPMLAKSQCWCVDGVSKFVMRIRGANYYRIELPCENLNDENQVDLLKAVLDKILQYEKTPCPFKRGFTVELPEPPETPVKKVPWRPKIDHRLSTSDATINSQAQDCRHDPCSHTQVMDERPTLANMQDQEAQSPAKKVADFPDDLSEGGSPAGIDQEDYYFSRRGIQHLGVHRFGEIKARLDSPANANAVDPPKQPNVTTSASLIMGDVDQDAHSSPDPNPQMVSIETQSEQSSPASFYSTLSASEAESPSLEATPGAHNPSDAKSSRGEKAALQNPATASSSWELSDSASVAFIGRTGSLPNTRTIGPSIETCKPGLRVRRELEKRRTISPMPSSTNLSLSYSPSPYQQRQVREITNSLLERACFYLIKPPLHLLALMIKVAMQITRGSLQGSLNGFGDKGEKIPCSWDFSSDGSDASDDTWDEDDYGVKLGHTVSGKNMSRASNGNWEID